MRGLLFVLVLCFLCVKAITNPCQVTSEKVYDEAMETMEQRMACEGSMFHGPTCAGYWMHQGKLDRAEIFNQVCRDSKLQENFEFLGTYEHPGIFKYEQEKTSALVKDESEKLYDRIEGAVEHIEDAVKREEHETRRTDEYEEEELRKEIYEGVKILEDLIKDGVYAVEESISDEVKYDAQETRKTVYEDAVYTDLEVKVEEELVRDSFRHLEKGIKESWEELVSQAYVLLEALEWGFNKEKDTAFTLLNHINLQTDSWKHGKKHTILNQFTPVDLFQRPGPHYEKMRDICYESIQYNREHYGNNPHANAAFESAEVFKTRGDFRAAAYYLREAYSFAVVPPKI
jgi:hypothetical protein